MASTTARTAACDTILGPTQRAVYDRVCERSNLAKESQADGPQVPPLRMVRLGVAGTGETHGGGGCIVQNAREIFGPEDSVFASAHTGVAASNVGRGAKTLESLCRTNAGGRLGVGGAEKPASGAGDSLRSLHRLFARRTLLITDEICMVGAQ